MEERGIWKQILSMNKHPAASLAAISSSFLPIIYLQASAWRILSSLRLYFMNPKQRRMSR
jgi:hypothetical protein